MTEAQGRGEETTTGRCKAATETPGPEARPAPPFPAEGPGSCSDRTPPVGPPQPVSLRTRLAFPVHAAGHELRGECSRSKVKTLESPHRHVLLHQPPLTVMWPCSCGGIRNGAATHRRFSSPPGPPPCRPRCSLSPCTGSSTCPTFEGSKPSSMTPLLAPGCSAPPTATEKPGCHRPAVPFSHTCPAAGPAFCHTAESPSTQPCLPQARLSPTTSSAHLSPNVVQDMARKSSTSKVSLTVSCPNVLPCLPPATPHVQME